MEHMGGSYQVVTNRPLLVTTKRLWPAISHGFLSYFSSYFSFFTSLYIYFRLHSVLFSELMIKKTWNNFISNSRCLYGSWIRVIFAKVLMLSESGAYTSALRAFLLATWIYSEYWVKPLSFPFNSVQKSHKNNKNLSLLSIRHSSYYPLHRSFLVHC